jgi:cell wall-associated NlpC family hydrolase
MKNYTKYTALISTILLSSALAGPANAETPTTGQLESVPTTETSQIVTVKAESTSHLTFEKPAITTTPAPVVVEPLVAYVAPQASKVAVAPTTTAPSAPRAVTSPPAAPASRPAVPVGSGSGAALLASAYSQIGITQDCTAMVERALGSLGIITGDLAPAQFFRYGTVVGSPAPGDILISAGHVGIYAGNGQMISGGFNGSQTVLHPVSYVGAFSAVRVA